MFYDKINVNVFVELAIYIFKVINLYVLQVSKRLKDHLLEALYICFLLLMI